MKVQSTKELDTNVDTSSRKQMGIVQSAQMYQMLSDRLYSNKPLAVIRELACNAYDAQLKAGTQDLAFDVHLPTKYNPYFSIRDYGTGLSEQDIYELYCTYGNSSKSDSDEFIGGFGLGSKSPFAYTDQFTVSSYFNGVKSIYTAFYGEDGCPEVVKVSECETEEKNGLEVYVNVKPEDFSKFKSVAEDIFDPFPVKPNCNEKLEYTQTEENLFLEVENQFKLYKRKNHRPYHSRIRKCKVQVGLVQYPVDRDVVTEINEHVRAIFNSEIVLNFDITDIKVTVNRESIDYCEGTVEKIIKKAQEASDSLKKKGKELLDAETTQWNKLAAANELYQLLPLTTQSVRDIVVEDLQVNLEGVEGNISSITATHLHSYVRPTLKQGWNYIMPKSNKRVVLVPSGSKSVALTLKHNTKKDSKVEYVVVTAQPEQFPSILDGLGNPEAIKFEDLDKPPKVQTSRGKSKPVPVFTCWLGSTNWRPVEHDFDNGGVYVESNSKVLQSERFSDCGDFQDVLDLVSKVELLGTQQFFIVQKSSMSKLKKSQGEWIKLEDLIYDKLKSLSDCDLFAEILYGNKTLNSLDTSLETRRLINLCSRFAEADLNKNSPILQFNNCLKSLGVKFHEHPQLKNFDRDSRTAVYNFEKLFKYSDLTVKEFKSKDGENLKSLMEKIPDRYPMIFEISGSTDSKAALHYLHLCDSNPRSYVNKFK